MSDAYPYCLAPDAASGNIDGIYIKWQASALGKKLDGAAKRVEEPRELLKPLTEHFLYLSCLRLGNDEVKIYGPPHRFTKAIGQTYAENAEHVSGIMKGRNPGSVHVYLEGNNWLQMRAMGETFVRKGNSGIDPSLSWGNYPSPDPNNAWFTGSGYPQASTSSSSTILGSAQYSLPQQAVDGSWVRFNYVTGEWEDAVDPGMGAEYH
ncbi:hypothetical protein GGR55DRAFT_678328 [Xylaria sp. FL0064]|nr:hypothetical protein GGR55DRAFT_678328 [Xylaria sp. FL0064]